MKSWDRPKWKEALWLVKDMYVHLFRMAYREPRRFAKIMLLSAAQPQIFFTALGVDAVFMTLLGTLYTVSPPALLLYFETLFKTGGFFLLLSIAMIQGLIVLGLVLNHKAITPFMYSIFFDRSNWRSKETLGSLFFILGVVFFMVSLSKNTSLLFLSPVGLAMWLITSLFATTSFFRNNGGGGKGRKEFPTGGVPEITVH